MSITTRKGDGGETGLDFPQSPCSPAPGHVHSVLPHDSGFRPSAFTSASIAAGPLAVKIESHGRRELWIHGNNRLPPGWHRQGLPSRHTHNDREP
jgi:hypothetical protein